MLTTARQWTLLLGRLIHLTHNFLRYASISEKQVQIWNSRGTMGHRSFSVFKGCTLSVSIGTAGSPHMANLTVASSAILLAHCASSGCLLPFADARTF
jgi:hypothetical protein